MKRFSSGDIIMAGQSKMRVEILSLNLKTDHYQLCIIRDEYGKTNLSKTIIDFRADILETWSLCPQTMFDKDLKAVLK